MNKPIKLINDSINFEDLQALGQWISFGPQLTKGGLTPQLEARFAEFVGTKYSVFVNSGSSAILLGLIVLKQSGLLFDNNKIIIPSLSWATDLSIPDILGFKPYLCDTNLEDLSVDLNHLEHLFQTKKPSVFILVSVLGLVPKMKEIVELCNKYGVILLEDCCERTWFTV